jgi:NADH-quinone oxidoreductase subunit G
VPFYAGLTLEEIGGRGIRWPETDAARAWGGPGWDTGALGVPPAAAAARDGSLRLGTFRSLWAAKEVDVSPVLHFLRAKQVAELSPEDARSLGVVDGDRVEVGTNGTRLQAPARVRAAVPPGSVFLVEGALDEPANVFTEPLVEVRRA